MIIKFVTLPETNCAPGKQSWQDVSNLLKNKIEANFKNGVEFQHSEFMSENWFNDKKLTELAERTEFQFPIIMINNELFSNGEKVNIGKIIRKIGELL